MLYKLKTAGTSPANIPLGYTIQTLTVEHYMIEEEIEWYNSQKYIKAEEEKKENLMVTM
jgi:hypothetical protein